MNYQIVVHNFEVQSRYYVHLRNGMNLFTPPTIFGINSTTTVFLQGWIWHQINHEGCYAIKDKQTKYKYIL